MNRGRCARRRVLVDMRGVHSMPGVGLLLARVSQERSRLLSHRADFLGEAVVVSRFHERSSLVGLWSLCAWAEYPHTMEWQCEAPILTYGQEIDLGGHFSCGSPRRRRSVAGARTPRASVCGGMMRAAVVAMLIPLSVEGLSGTRRVELPREGAASARLTT